MTSPWVVLETEGGMVEGLRVEGLEGGSARVDVGVPRGRRKNLWASSGDRVPET